MSVLLFLLLTSVTAGAAVYIVLSAGFAFAKLRGTRLVSCPETGKPASVALASFRGALAAPFAKKPVTVNACNRWPERASCAQQCLSEIADTPGGCLVRGVVQQWYAGHECAICRRPFGNLSLAEHRPALLAADGSTLQWHEVRPEKLPETFTSHRPVCWNCHVIRTLALERPDVVVVRPAHPDPQQLM